MTLDLRLNDGLDAEALSAKLREKGRLQIKNFLDPEAAMRLHAALLGNRIWYLTFNDGAQNSELPIASYANMPAEQRRLFLQRINGRASTQFQFLFMQYYISEAIKRNEDAGHALHEAHAFMNSEPCLAFMRTLTEEPRLREADVLASAFRPGHFLTNHDDSHGSRDRVAAWVVSMAKDWRCDWGGHLAFFDEDGNIKDAFCPSFNTLNIFLVPQPHAVQQIAPFALQPRLSLAGWLHR